MSRINFEVLAELARHQLSRWSDWKWDHSLRVSTHARNFGRFLGLNAREQDLLSKAGLLHDWGQILCMPTDLDWKEAEHISLDDIAKIRSHPSESYLLIQKFFGDPELANLILSHHCRLPHQTGRNGVNDCGYPSEFCRYTTLEPIHWALILCDSYDAMTGYRSYRTSCSPEVALLTLRNQAAVGAIDKEMIKKFIEWKKHHG